MWLMIPLAIVCVLLVFLFGVFVAGCQFSSMLIWSPLLFLFFVAFLLMTIGLQVMFGSDDR